MTTLRYEILYGLVFVFMNCAAALTATLARKGVPKTVRSRDVWDLLRCQRTWRCTFNCGSPTHKWIGSRVTVGANPGR
jgi:hypothetical protein